MVAPSTAPGALIGNPLPHVNGGNGFPREVPLHVLRVVATAIRHAWSIICSDPATHLLNPGPKAPEEDIYTDAVCQLLNQMLGEESPTVPGFTGAIIDSVIRAESICNYDGRELNKNPDLVIRLANEPLVSTRRWVGVFVESKIVSTSHTMDGYATNGIGRFVRGEYAWAMSDGIMLAYQKPKYRPMNALTDRLISDSSLCTQPYNGVLLVERDGFAPISGRSSHTRDWSYLGGGAPGAIQIWHLWDLATPDLTTAPTAGRARRSTRKSEA